MTITRTKQFYFAFLSVFIFLALATLAIETWGFVTNSNLKSMIDESAYRLEKTSEETSLLTQMQQSYDKAYMDNKYLNTALPDQKDASALISDLNSLAASSGLKLVLVQSNAVKTTAVTPDPSLLQTTRGKYSRELPLAFEVVGPYNSFIDFVQKLENYQRLVNITSMDIEKSQDKDAPADQIDVKFNLTAYLK